MLLFDITNVMLQVLAFCL